MRNSCWRNSSKSLLVAGAGALISVSGASYAQSSVTLYGVVDVAVTNRTGVPGGSQVLMTEGVLQGSRWGLRGTEDLGDGWKALFQLENGFQVYNGQFDQQGQLFGRQAWVGLSKYFANTTNTVSFGRQYTIPFVMLYNFDPLGWAGNIQMAWPNLMQGCRFDNTMQYHFQSGQLDAMLQYSLGGQPGSMSKGSTFAAGSTYKFGQVMAGFSVQQSRDAENRMMRFGAVGANVGIGSANIYALYQLGLRDPNFTPGAAGTTTPLANTSLLSNAGNPTTRRDSVFDVGVGYQITPALRTTVAVMYDSVSGIAGKTGGDTTVYALADYLLSKRTDVYAGADYTRLTGAEVGNPYAIGGNFQGAHSRTEISAGLRTRF